MMPLTTPDIREHARSELEKLSLQKFSDGATVSVHLRDGVAYDEIATATWKFEAALIITATQGHTGLSHALLGRTAERVLRHPPCPVLKLQRARGISVRAQKIYPAGERKLFERLREIWPCDE